MHSLAVLQILQKIRERDWDEAERRINIQMYVNTDAAFDIAHQLYQANRSDIMQSLLKSGRVNVDNFSEKLASHGNKAMIDAFSIKPIILPSLAEPDISDDVYHLIVHGHVFDVSLGQVYTEPEQARMAWLTYTAMLHSNTSFIGVLLKDAAIRISQTLFTRLLNYLVSCNSVDLTKRLLHYPGTLQYTFEDNVQYGLHNHSNGSRAAMLRVLFADRRFQLNEGLRSTIVTNNLDVDECAVLLDYEAVTDVEMSFVLRTLFDKSISEHCLQRAEVFLVKGRYIRGFADLVQDTILDLFDIVPMYMRSLMLLTKLGFIHDDRSLNKIFITAASCEKDRYPDVVPFMLPYIRCEITLMDAMDYALDCDNHMTLNAILLFKPSILHRLSDSLIQSLPLEVVLSLLPYKSIREPMMVLWKGNHDVKRTLHHQACLIHQLVHDFTEAPPGINYWLPDGGPVFLEAFREMFPDSAPPSSYLNTKIQKKIYKYKI